MKHTLFSIAALFFITASIFLFGSCEGMFDEMEKYYGEVVYPAKYDTIVAQIGYERAEIDLIKAGRIPSSQIKMGKAKKTVIEYDDEKIIIDSLVSWINLTGLTQSKIYRIHIYTIDEFGNQSVPQEVAVIPYTKSDLEALAVISPRIMTSPTSAVVEWPNGFGTVLLTYYGLSYSYTDKDGKTISGERGDNARFFVSNLETGKSYTLHMKYKVVPKMNNEPILDMLEMERELTVNIPTGATSFSPAEREILEKNGVTTFTFDNTASVSKLVYPVHANSLQDVFYFSNLKELDLTGGTLFEVPVLHYDRDAAKVDVGGGAWQPFMSSVREVGDIEALKDLLEAGAIEKIRYAPHTMGLDDLLAPYVASGVVELVTMPDEALIGYEYFLDGLVQDWNWRTDFTYPSDAPNADGLQNVFKVKCVGSSSTFVYALPKEYRYNVSEYKYLRMRIYAPAKSELENGYETWQRIWFRFMNNMWAFGGNSDFGQEYWDYDRDRDRDKFTIPDSDLQTWYDMRIDLSEMANRHNRIIVVNIGGEPGWEPNDRDITYYFADVRFTKE